jgi:hypothetical protein
MLRDGFGDPLDPLDLPDLPGVSNFPYLLEKLTWVLLHKRLFSRCQDNIYIVEKLTRFHTFNNCPSSKLRKL